MNQKTTSRSGLSEKSKSDDEEDFETCLMEIFKKFHSPVPVTIIKEYERRDIRTQKTRLIKTTYKNVTLASVATLVSSGGSESNVAVKDIKDDSEEVTLPITTLYDTQNHLSAILIDKFQEEIIPRDTIYLLTLILPNYRQLSKFTIKNCRIDMHVVHELGKVLPYTAITDICLDDCPQKQANYEELLQNSTFLKNLSLCRCNINDAVCERIATKLHFLESAEPSLVTLNLSSNRIGDQGAKYFADALRSNRHLRYLNLADNLISDEGARHIFNSLIEFPLTYDENSNRRQRFIVYMKKKQEVYKECLHKLSFSQKSAETIHSNIGKLRSHDKIHLLPPKRASLHSQIKRKPKKRENAKSLSLSTLPLYEDDLPKRAELIAREMLGSFVDPFCASKVEDYPHCDGNFVLCYLNLAYNDLTFTSVSKLLSVVEYQRAHYKPDACGLMKVVLEGNFLPVACMELMSIQKMLNQHVASFQSK